VHFANEALDLHSRGGRLSADIQAVVAADYVRNLREEAKKGIYGRLKQGFYPMRAPIGYLDNGAGKPKTIDPVKGPLVKKAFTMYAAGGWNMPDLADELFRMGLRNHAEGRVTLNGLSTILSNPFYLGLIRIRKTGQTFDGNHEPLISKRLFDEVRDIAERRLNARSKVHELLFRKTVKCKGCGYSLIGEMQKGHVYYRCHTSTCPTASIREEVIETSVLTEFEKLQFTEAEKNYLAGATRELKKNWLAEREGQCRNLHIKLQQVNERLTRLTDAFLNNTIEKDLFEERKTTLLFERREIEDQRKALEDKTRSLPDELQKFIELAGDAYLLYGNATLEKKRQMLKVLTSNLTLEAKNVDIALAIPFREIANREKSSDGRPSKGMVRTLDELFRNLVMLVAQGTTLDNISASTDLA
jgi:hypothetical protein